MKLLYCKKCKDIFNLVVDKTKSCGCGETKGVYLEDGLNAIYSGDAVPLGFSNTSFMPAVKHPPMYEPSIDFKAFVIPVECKTFKKLD